MFIAVFCWVRIVNAIEFEYFWTSSNICDKHQILKLFFIGHLWIPEFWTVSKYANFGNIWLIWDQIFSIESICIVSNYIDLSRTIPLSPLPIQSFIKSKPHHRRRCLLLLLRPPPRLILHPPVLHRQDPIPLLHWDVLPPQHRRRHHRQTLRFHHTLISEIIYF